MARYLNRGVHVAAAPTANLAGHAAVPPKPGANGKGQPRAIESGVNDDVARIASRFAELRALIDAHASDVVEPDMALRDLAELHTEVSRTTPDPARQRAALERLARRMAAVTPAVAILTELARTLLPPDP